MAGTGYAYYTRRNVKSGKPKLLLRKYDPVIREHTLFKVCTLSNSWVNIYLTHTRKRRSAELELSKESESNYPFKSDIIFVNKPRSDSKVFFTSIRKCHEIFKYLIRVARFFQFIES